MKIKFVMVGLLGLVSATTFAQKGELKSAREGYDKYEAMKANPAMASMAVNFLTGAKTAIDKAAANEKTATLPETYAVKGVIYALMAASDTVPATATPLYTTAEEAIKKAKETDTEKKFADLIGNGSKYLAQYNLNNGVKQYTDQKYELAYTSFDKYREILPDDTNALYYTALAAVNAAENGKNPKYYALAVPNYQKLLTTNFSKNEELYFDLSTIHLMNKDTASALKIIAEGIAKYPTKANLRTREIEISLMQGKDVEAVSKITAAIANEPKNKSLYYYAGITYAKIADNYARQALKKGIAPAEKTALVAKKTENYTKGIEMYKKALEIDPNYADAALGIGYVMVNPAIDVYNAANALPVSKQKEYDAAIAKSNALFEEAKPYLLKAVELNPKSVDALTNLKNYYLGKKDNVNATATQKKIEALEASKTGM